MSMYSGPCASGHKKKKKKRIQYRAHTDACTQATKVWHCAVSCLPPTSSICTCIATHAEFKPFLSSLTLEKKPLTVHPSIHTLSIIVRNVYSPLPIYSP